MKGENLMESTLPLPIPAPLFLTRLKIIAVLEQDCFQSEKQFCQWSFDPSMFNLPIPDYRNQQEKMMKLLAEQMIEALMSRYFPEEGAQADVE